MKTEAKVKDLDESVCNAFEHIVGRDVRRGIRCDDAEAAYTLELDMVGTVPTPVSITLWLLRSDGRRIQLWPYPGRVGRDTREPA